MIQILRDFSPRVEVYSIDESFLRIDGLLSMWSSYTALGQAIRQRVKQWTGLPVYVGVGHTKTLAKLANHLAKKRPEFQGVCDLSDMNDTELAGYLSTVEVDEVWGVGRRIAERLDKLGILTVQQLRQAEPKSMRQHFGVVMERTVAELQGLSCLALEEVSPPRKQIVSSRSFGQMVATLQELREAVSTYAARAGEKLRADRSLCCAAHVFVQPPRSGSRMRSTTTAW